MHLSFYGAAGEVTGSCSLVETGGPRVLVDFGLHQGGGQAAARNRRVPPINASRIDAVVLTHAHIDHAGRLPLLPGLGYRGPIFATPATIDLAEILLRDAARIQMLDADRQSRRRASQGRPPVAPLYDEHAVEAVLPLFRPVPYDRPTEIAPGVVLRFTDAGHILGSASAEIAAEAGGGRRVIAFSGDIGPRDGPLLRDPVPPAGDRPADLVVLESTYGDRDHRPIAATIDELAGVLGAASSTRGKVIVPAFAVGRTQALLYHFHELHGSGRWPGGPVFVDSPMAVEATDLYRRHRDLFDDAARARVCADGSCFVFPGLTFTPRREESEAINTLPGRAVIISASGMCTGGRVLHHLKHHLWRPESHVVFVGFQAEGTLGRRLVDGARQVRVMGEPIAVRAAVHTINGLSAHAGKTGLIAWASAMAAGRPRFVLNHGEPRPRALLAQDLSRRLGVEVVQPEWGHRVEV